MLSPMEVLMITVGSVQRAGILFLCVALCLPAALVFGYGAGFDSGGLPAGAKLLRPAATGLLVYKLVTIGTSYTATLSFVGKCGGLTVTLPDLDVTTATGPNNFYNGSGGDIATTLEGQVFLTFQAPAQVAALAPCYPHKTLGGLILNDIDKYVKVNLAPGNAVWVGEVSINGFKF
jgi:hypothetical protein